MDPAAESNAAAPPSGAVVVNVAASATVGAAAPARRAAAASAAVGAAAPARRAAAASATVGAAAAARRAAAQAARYPRAARWVVALALLFLGFATVSLALFAMSLPAADAGVMGRRCARTDAEAADLWAASELLLVAASAQVLTATATVLVPSPPLAFVALTVGSYTALSAADVVWMLLACHGRVHGVVAFHYWFFYAVTLGTLLVGGFIVMASCLPRSHA